MDSTPRRPDSEREGAKAPERPGLEEPGKAGELPGVCPICRRRVCGDEPTQCDVDSKDHRAVELDETVAEGEEAGPTSRDDFDLDHGLDAEKKDDSAIKFLFPDREAERLGRWGPYEIQRELGRGGMGIVFKGFDFALRRVVAIKVMSPALATSERSRARFVRESRAMAAINHPNIVAIHAVNERRGLPYLVMEYVAGEALDARIRRLGSLSVREVLCIGAQIADGLEAAHALGTIHRDIKPANVMLGLEGDRVKISDFGLALVMLENSNLTPANHLLGTPSYTAPEVIKGRVVDARADLFSLGCVIHAMATGRSPFAGGNIIEVAHRVCVESPKRLDQIRPEIPRALADLTLRLLKKDPDDRVQTAAEVASALRRALEGQGLETKGAIIRSPKRERTNQRRRRRAALWAVGGSLVVALAIASAWAPVSRWLWSSSMTIPKLIRLEVSGRETARFASLADAIARASPGSTIRLSEGEYEGPIRIEGSEASRGLAIDAPDGAILLAPSGSIAVVEIRDAPGVSIRGLTIRCSSPDQHGIVFYGDVAGAKLERVRVEQAAGARAAAVHATPGTHGSPEAPLLLQGLDVEAEGLGIVLGDGTSARPVSFVRIEGSRIHGGGLLVVLERAVHDVVLRGNILEGGESGLSLALAGVGAPVNVEARNNTFFNCDAWINLGSTGLGVSGIDISRNLILDCGSVIARTPDIEVVGPRWFRENVWRKVGAEVGLVARSVDAAPLLSTDPRSPDYLRPADPASVSIKDPATGETAFAGAVSPAPPPSREEDRAEPHL